MLDAPGITAADAGLALSAAQGLAGNKTREIAARTLRDLAETYGLSSVVRRSVAVMLVIFNDAVSTAKEEGR